MSKSEIKKILSNLKISNYSIEKLGTGESFIVNAYNVTIVHTISEFPIKFGYIERNFGCTHNALTTLKNSPQEVGGYFSCGGNSLTDIIGAPNIVGGNFSCYDNRITSLKGLPEKIGGHLICNDNNIRDIYDISNIQGSIYISILIQCML